MKITCPTCKGVTTWEENPFRPFCSERCKLIDIGRWADEEYRIPGKAHGEGKKNDEEEPEDERDGGA